MPTYSGANLIYGTPRGVLIGNPTTASGAGLFDFGAVPRFAYSINPHTSYPVGLGGRAKANSAYTRGAMFESVQVDFFDFHLDILEALFPGILARNAGNTVMTMKDSFGKLSLPTLCIIPGEVTGNALNHPHTIWLPAVYPDGAIEISGAEPQDGENSTVYTVTFKVFDRETDQDDTAIPAGFRGGFMGKATETVSNGGPGLTWSLPSAYTS